MEKKKHAGGRPPKYNKELHPKLAAALAARGLSNPEIFKEMEISEATFYYWCNSHPEFLEQLSKAREGRDDQVENALFKRAIGFTWTEEQAIKVKVDKDKEEIKIIEIEKTVPPDTPAASLWLRNRRPNRWSDKQQVEHSGEINVTDMTPEQRAARIAQLEAKKNANRA